MMKKIFILVLIIFFSLQSCDEEMVSRIPIAPVNVILDLNYRDHDLNGKLTCLKITKERIAEERGKLGYGGILVINGFGPDPVNLFAYDLACPVEATKTIQIVPDDAGRATCPNCGAVYNIADGYGTPSTTKYWLKAYRVVPINVTTREYRVTN